MNIILQVKQMTFFIPSPLRYNTTIKSDYYIYRGLGITESGQIADNSYSLSAPSHTVWSSAHWGLPWGAAHPRDCLGAPGNEAMDYPYL